MPINYQINNEVCIFTTVGDIDYHEGINVLKEGLERIKTFDPALILFDIRLSKENRSSDEIFEITKVIKSMVLSRLKIALLVDGDLYYGLSRMFSSYIEEADIRTNVFKQYDDALTWLLSQ